MKKISKGQVAVWVLALAPLVLIALVYSKLPARIPIHWGLNGEVEYGDKWKLWIMAGMSLLMAVMFYFQPLFDPKKKNYDKFSGSYIGFQLVLMLFMLMLTGICITEAFRPGTVDVAMLVCLFVSLMMVYLGNVMPKFRMNWFCGIKNPWTLSSETVWTRTHRLAGRLFFASGLIGAAGAFVPNEVVRFVLLLAPLTVAALIPTVCSFLWYRRERSSI